jgi:hypothetical protein
MNMNGPRTAMTVLSSLTSRVGITAFVELCKSPKEEKGREFRIQNPDATIEQKNLVCGNLLSNRVAKVLRGSTSAK